MRATDVKRAQRFSPVTYAASPGWPDCSSGSSSQLPWSRRRAGGVQLERPQPRSGEDERAGRRRAAATDPREPRRVFHAGVLRVAWLSRRGWRSDLTSTHSAFRRHSGGRHDHVSGDRAAQSCDRVRPDGRLMPRGRACPELGDPPGLGSLHGGQAAALVCGFVVPGVTAGCASASRW
jgi:hypothetical protein